MGLKKKKEHKILYFRYATRRAAALIEGKSIPFLILPIVKINSNPILYPCLLTTRPPPSSPRMPAVFIDNCDERELVNRRGSPRGDARSGTIPGSNFNEVLRGTGKKEMYKNALRRAEK